MENRAAHRFPTDLEAECRSCNRTWTSRLCNISATGCMIECPEPSLPESALLRLRLRGLTAIDGQVVWQNRGHVGIRFNVPLHQAVMEHLGFREAEIEMVTETAPDSPPVADPSPASLAPASPVPAPQARLAQRTWQEEPEIRTAASA